MSILKWYRVTDEVLISWPCWIYNGSCVSYCKEPIVGHKNSPKWLPKDALYFMPVEIPKPPPIFCRCPDFYCECEISKPN